MNNPAPVVSSASAPSGLAGRYTAALLDFTQERKGGNEALEADLTRLLATLENQPALMTALASPLVAREKQEQLLARFLRDNQFCEPVSRLVLLLVRNRRAGAIATVAREAIAELARRRGEITAEVVSATALSGAQQDKLAQILTRKLGQTPRIKVVEDPRLLAGFVVYVGSRMFDGSLRGRLNRLHLAMTNAS